MSGAEQIASKASQALAQFQNGPVQRSDIIEAYVDLMKRCADVGLLAQPESWSIHWTEPNLIEVWYMTADQPSYYMYLRHVFSDVQNPINDYDRAMRGI